MDFLSGYKTYIVILAGLMAVFAAFVSGDVTLADAINQAVLLLGFGGLRSGIKRV